MGARPRCYITENWLRSGHHLVIVQSHEPGKVSVATGFTWAEYNEGDRFDEQAGINDADDLIIQAIVDEAWRAGFRPAGFSDVKNETAAIRDHLRDMRSIAFKKLGMTDDPV